MSEKPNNRNRSEQRDEILGRAMARGVREDGAVTPCPSPEQMAALVDGSVSGADRDSLLGHLAVCGKCRQVFVTARALVQEEVADGGRSWFVIPSALAVAVLLVLALTLTLRQPPVEQVRVAKLEEPAGSPGAVPAKAGEEPAKKAGRAAAPGKETLPTAGIAAEPVMLLTMEEAALPGSKSFGFAAHGGDDGPAILVKDLEVGADRGTFSLKVGFAPKSGGDVDLATLKLECLKSSPIDLTPRVMPYAGREGIVIERVSLPPGSYRFRVAIGDFNGRLSEKEFTVKVSVTY